MFKLTVDQILASIEALSPDEKQALAAQLSSVMGHESRDRNLAPGQSSSVSVGGDFTVQGSGVTADFSQTYAAGNLQSSRQNTNTSGSTADLDRALAELAQLKQAIASSSELNVIEKQSVAVPVETLAAELQKPQPDKGLIDQAIVALKKGLEGVQTLAEPVTKVAALVAKAWIAL